MGAAGRPCCDPDARDTVLRTAERQCASQERCISRKPGDETSWQACKPTHHHMPHHHMQQASLFRQSS